MSQNHHQPVDRPGEVRRDEHQAVTGANPVSGRPGEVQRAEHQAVKSANPAAGEVRRDEPQAAARHPESAKRFDAKQLSLTYPQCPMDKEEAARQIKDALAN